MKKVEVTQLDSGFVSLSCMIEEFAKMVEHWWA